ncbi:MAG: TIGR04086 family membrane protein [Desulfitobacteriaceae bacterium]
MSNSFQVNLVLKGILMAIALALILSLGYGLLLSLSSIPESDLVINLIFSLSVFAAASIMSNKAGTKGLIYGLAIGLGFIILLLLLSAMFFSETVSMLRIGEKVIIALAAGGIGGIVGVVFRRS